MQNIVTRYLNVDAVLLGSMALLGLCGTIIFFTQPQGLGLAPFQTASIAPQTVELHGYTASTENCLTIGEQHSTDAPVTFKIDHYNRNASYWIDYGDGNSEQATSCEFAHQYVKEGNYQINLFMEYLGEKKLISCKNLNVF